MVQTGDRPVAHASLQVFASDDRDCSSASISARITRIRSMWATARLLDTAVESATDRSDRNVAEC